MSAGLDAEAGKPPLRRRGACIGLEGGGDGRHAERLLQVKGSARFSAVPNVRNDTTGGILPAMLYRSLEAFHVPVLSAAMPWPKVPMRTP